MPFSIVVRFNHISEMQQHIKDRATNAVRDNAHFAQTYGTQIAPRQTGAFAASLYVSGPDNESDYSRGASQALGLRPAAPIVGEITPGAVDSNRNAITAVVSSAVGYAIYLEEGTAYMAPRPTLRPSAEVTRPRFIADMSKIAD